MSALERLLVVLRLRSCTALISGLTSLYSMQLVFRQAVPSHRRAERLRLCCCPGQQYTQQRCSSPQCLNISSAYQPRRQRLICRCEAQKALASPVDDTAIMRSLLKPTGIALEQVSNAIAVLVPVLDIPSSHQDPDSAAATAQTIGVQTIQLCRFGYIASSC